MRLRIPDPAVHVTPTSVLVEVDGADDNEQVEFTFDNVVVWRTDVDSGGSLDNVTVPLDVQSTAGSHTLRVTGSRSGESASHQITVRRNSFQSPRIPPTDADAVDLSDATGWHRQYLPEMHHLSSRHTHRHWMFQDLAPGGLGIWVLPINPTAMTSPHWSRNLQTTHTTSHKGRPMVWQQSHHARDWEFSGFCPDQSFHDQLLAYRKLTRKIYIVDHRKRAWKCVIKDVDLVARNDPHRYWAHNYTVRAVIYNHRDLAPK